MRLLLDEHHDPEVANGLRERGYDVVAVAARDDLRGLSDADILGAAAAEGRAVVTENARDFVTLARRWVAEGVPHHGVIVTSPQRYPRRPDARMTLVDDLAHLLEERPAAAALRDLVIWL